MPPSSLEPWACPTPPPESHPGAAIWWARCAEGIVPQDAAVVDRLALTLTPTLHRCCAPREAPPRPERGRRPTRLGRACPSSGLGLLPRNKLGGSGVRCLQLQGSGLEQGHGCLPRPACCAPPPTSSPLCTPCTAGAALPQASHHRRGTPSTRENAVLVPGPAHAIVRWRLLRTREPPEPHQRRWWPPHKRALSRSLSPSSSQCSRTMLMRMDKIHKKNEKIIN